MCCNSTTFVIIGKCHPHTRIIRLSVMACSIWNSTKYKDEDTFLPPVLLPQYHHIYFGNVEQFFYPILRTYLYHVKKTQYRHSIAKLRCSSHALEIERGRHTSPKTPVADRKCLMCYEIEDERHFVLKCIINNAERECFFEKVSLIYNDFTDLEDEQKFLFIMTTNHPQCLKWLGKFLHDSFIRKYQHTLLES